MLFYNLGIRIYSFLIRCFSLFNPKARLFIDGRKDIFKNLENFYSSNQKPVIWFHCASLGEFEQGRPLIEKLKKDYPRYHLLLTFFSPSGYEIRKNYEMADYVCYLPIDSALNAKKFISIVRPTMAIFIKYEFWLNYLHQLHKKKIPVLLVSGIFRPEQHFFKWYGSIFRKSLKQYKHLFLQNEQSLQLVKTLGINNCSVSGDTRFDRVYELSKNRKSLPEVEKFTEGRLAIIAGSTWPSDEEFVVSSFSKLKKTMKNTCLVIAPHEVDLLTIKNLEDRLTEKNMNYHLLSHLSPNYSSSDVLVIDSIGILSSVYQYGCIAYVGGGFDSGIHNILEALTYGLPVIFGPNHQKYDEALTTIKNGTAFSFNTVNELNAIFSDLLNQPELLKEVKQKSIAYVEKNMGSSEKIIDYLFTQKLVEK